MLPYDEVAASYYAIITQPISRDDLLLEFSSRRIRIPGRALTYCRPWSFPCSKTY